MKTLNFYKKYNGKASDKIHRTITGSTEHECWKKLMKYEGIRNLAYCKTKFATKPGTTKSVGTTLTVNLKAFTEMYLGTYIATKTKNGYEIVLKNGKKMAFDKTGLQVDAKNPRYANRIELA